MTIAITHAFQSAKGDGTDATLVRPSNWNAAHTTSMATGKMVGRLTAGTGVFEELPLSAFMSSLLNAADAATLAGLLGVFETGDVKWTFKNSASPGWILIDGVGSIGSATSGATIRANADTQNLYTVIWNSVADADAPVAGGRGVSAAADFAANKPMTIPGLGGRTPIGANTAGASGISSRTLGRVYGEESHVLTLTETPAGITSGGVNSISVILGGASGGNGVPITATPGNIGPSQRVTQAGAVDATSTSGSWSGASATSSGTNNIAVTSNNTGGAGHNNMQPSIALFPMVKL